MAKRLYSLAAAVVAASIAFSAGPGFAHETKAGSLTIINMWSRATVSTSRPAVGYLTIINNSTEPDRLLGAESPVAGMVHLHMSSMKDGVMMMKPVDGIDIPPGGTVRLAPGGYHLMLVEPKKIFREGDKLPLTLVFEKAGKVEVEADVRPIGARGGM